MVERNTGDVDHGVRQREFTVGSIDGPGDRRRRAAGAISLVLTELALTGPGIFGAADVGDATATADLWGGAGPTIDGSAASVRESSAVGVIVGAGQERTLRGDAFSGVHSGSTGLLPRAGAAIFGQATAAIRLLATDSAQLGTGRRLAILRGFTLTAVAGFAAWADSAFEKLAAAVGNSATADAGVLAGRGRTGA